MNEPSWSTASHLEVQQSLRAVSVDDYERWQCPDVVEAKAKLLVYMDLATGYDTHLGSFRLEGMYHCFVSSCFEICFLFLPG